MQAFEGVVNNLERRYRETQSDAMRRDLEECMAERPCPDCGGKRLRKEALAVTVGVSASTLLPQVGERRPGLRGRLELTPRSTSSPTASSRRSRTALASSRVWGSSTSL